MTISSRQKLQSLNDYAIKIDVTGVKINQTKHSKPLRLYVDENLSWKEHIQEIKKKSLLVLVHSNGSGHLSPCALQLKYTKALLNHTLITAVLFGMACLNS